MKYVKTFEEFINESLDEIKNDEEQPTEEKESEEKQDDKPSLNEKMYDCIKQMYTEACEQEEDENPTHTMEGYMKESFLIMAEMCTRVLKENIDISKIAAKAAIKKSNNKEIDEDKIYDSVHDYINEMMKCIKESYAEKMEEMMGENPAIASIAAKALSQERTANPDANNS
jgi:hypothetical protein